MRSAALALMLLMAVAGARSATPGVGAADPAQAADPGRLSDAELREFVSVFRAIKDGYVEPVDDRRLLRAALSGMLSGLDPHSEYLEAEQLQQWDDDLNGSYGGVGIEVLWVDGYLRVVAPLDGSPAARAGVRSGDIILAIDGVEVGNDGGDASSRLRGAAGTKVRLTLDRERAGVPLDLLLVREIIRTRSVSSRWLEAGFAYLRISQFQQGTGADLRAELRRLGAGKSRLRGLVLDLRDNPGGTLDGAVQVADAFLDGGVVVSTRGRLAESNEVFNAHPGDLLDGAPMTVLVDQGTASASEIVAGALKDAGRALIIGGRTFGKGSVQKILPLPSGAAIKITTARYYTPAGTSIQAQGIVPDIELANLHLSEADHGAELISTESSLANHLAAEGSGSEPQSSTQPMDAELARDYPLATALNALKALTVARRALQSRAK